MGIKKALGVYFLPGGGHKIHFYIMMFYHLTFKTKVIIKLYHSGSTNVINLTLGSSAINILDQYNIFAAH